MSKDYYKILGVPSNATEQEIKRAYRDKARELHPDSNEQDQQQKKKEELFKEVSEAYSVLSYNDKRKMYDLTRTYKRNDFFSKEYTKEDFNEIIEIEKNYKKQKITYQV